MTVRRPLVVVSGETKELPMGDSVIGYMPTGAIVDFPCNAAPAGFLKANGALLSRATYADLWEFAQASGNISATDAAWVAGQFSPGDGSTNFRIPDMRGEFRRGWDDGRGIDSGRSIGSAQGDAIKTSDVTFTGTYSNDGTAPNGSPNYPMYDGYNAGSITKTVGQVGGATETRPRNVALLACIKY